MKIKILKLALFLNIAFLSAYSQAQTRANLDVFFQLADSAAVALLNKIPAEAPGVCLKTASQQTMQILEPRILARLKTAGKNVLTSPDSGSPCITLGVEDARVKYPDIFRDGLFGGYLVKREVSLVLSFYVTSRNRVTETGTLSFSHIDTVDQKAVKGLENPVHPFTQGDLPGEPLFQSLIEPVIALASLGTIIYLFFSVRSK